MTLQSRRGMSDLAGLEKVLEDFSDATGLATVVVSSQGVPVSPMYAFTDFCKAMRADPVRCQACQACDAHGGLQSLLMGTTQVYRCHAGLVDFSVPITDDNAYVGAILCGQVQLPEAEMPQYLMSRPDWHGDPRLEDLHADVPVMSKRKINAAAETLLDLHNFVDFAAARVQSTESWEDPAGPLVEVSGVGARPALAILPASCSITPRRAPHLQHDEDLAVLGSAMARVNLAAAFGAVSTLLDQAFEATDIDKVREGVARVQDTVLELAHQCAPRIVPHLSQLVVRQRRAADTNRYEAQLFVERLLILVFDESPQATAGRRRGIGDLLNDIARHPGRAMTLTEAARYLHWSPGHVSKLFKSVTGCTFVSYVTSRRIDRARLMLMSTDMAIQDIAAELHFSQVNYFSRVFKACTGVSPSEFRSHSSSRDGRPLDVTVPARDDHLLRA